MSKAKKRSGLFMNTAVDLSKFRNAGRSLKSDMMTKGAMWLVMESYLTDGSKESVLLDCSLESFEEAKVMFESVCYLNVKVKQTRKALYFEYELTHFDGWCRCIYFTTKTAKTIPDLKHFFEKETV